MNCSHSTGTHADAPNVDLEGGKTVIRTAATTLTYVLLLSAYPMTEVQPRLQKVLKSRWILGYQDYLMKLTFPEVQQYLTLPQARFPHETRHLTVDAENVA